MEDVMSESLLPSGVDVQFADIESALAGSSDDTRRAGGTALTATVVVAGPRHRLVEAAQAIAALKDVGVRAVLISYGDNPAPGVRVAGHTVALEGLRPDYLNNAVAALRLSSLPTLVWWRGGGTKDIEGLATLADRLVLDAEDPREVWKSVENLAQRTSVSDLRWARLTRWRALMANFFDIPEVCAAASSFSALRVEGSDRPAMCLFAGWLLSILGSEQRIVPDLREQSSLAPIEAVVLGDGTQQLVLRMAANRTCVQTAATVPNLPSACRTVSLGNQQLAALLGEELRIRARDVAFERAVAASRNVS
jgi:glucose-6-phosphate dehydrogenase assembly protein OpcA